jgi:hypothetical protein
VRHVNDISNKINEPIEKASPPQNRKTIKANKKKNTTCQYTIGRPSIPDNLGKKIMLTNVTSSDNPLLNGYENVVN